MVIYLSQRYSRRYKVRSETERVRCAESARATTNSSQTKNHHVGTNRRCCIHMRQGAPIEQCPARTGPNILTSKPSANYTVKAKRPTDCMCTKYRHIPAMLALKIDSCHQTQHRVDHQDEEVCHRFERAVEAQRHAGSRDGYIPQVLRHVLITKKKKQTR